MPSWTSELLQDYDAQKSGEEGEYLIKSVAATAFAGTSVTYLSCYAESDHALGMTVAADTVGELADASITCAHSSLSLECIISRFVHPCDGPISGSAC